MLEDRIMLITGKGGVGRTVICAALATALSTKAQVLLCDMGAPEGGHSPLARLFGQDNFAASPQKIAPNLMACHLTPEVGHEAFLRHSIPGGALLSAALKSPALRTFMQTAPSFVEMGWFYHLLLLIKERAPHSNDPRYRHIVVDLPATGHALALTGLPALLKRMIKRGPVAKALLEGESYLNSAYFCHSWVVTLPENLPLSEAIELVEGLKATNVPVGGIIMNRLVESSLSAEELIDLEKKLAKNPKILGHYELTRLSQSLSARERLRAECPNLSALFVHDFAQSGRALVADVADELLEVLK